MCNNRNNLTKRRDEKWREKDFWFLMRIVGSPTSYCQENLVYHFFGSGGNGTIKLESYRKALLLFRRTISGSGFDSAIPLWNWYRRKGRDTSCFYFLASRPYFFTRVFLKSNPRFLAPVCQTLSSILEFFRFRPALPLASHAMRADLTRF